MFNDGTSTINNLQVTRYELEMSMSPEIMKNPTRIRKHFGLISVPVSTFVTVGLQKKN